jgi:integrase/recombinase XerD
MPEDKRIGRTAVRKRQTVNGKQKTVRYSLDQAFELFYHAKAAEGLRQRTLVDYKTHHKYLTHWLSVFHPEVNTIMDISTALLREYVYYLSHDKPIVRC